MLIMLCYDFIKKDPSKWTCTLCSIVTKVTMEKGYINPVKLVLHTHIHFSLPCCYSSCMCTGMLSAELKNFFRAALCSQIKCNMINRPWCFLQSTVLSKNYYIQARNIFFINWQYFCLSDNRHSCFHQLQTCFKPANMENGVSTTELTLLLICQQTNI
jgi:hypothetical protein